MADDIALSVNGRPVTVPAGVSAAAAVACAGVGAFRDSVTGQPRAPLCGMGVCFECRVSIDGLPHQRSCQVPCRTGMSIVTGDSGNPVTRELATATKLTPPSARESFDVLVVGAGPAGLAAACCATERGRRVGLVDDNPDLGGQIWRTDSRHGPATPAANWINRLKRTNATVFPATQVIGQPEPGKLLVETAGIGAYPVAYEKLIVASGARERFLPFPGWTLPNVMGAGGLQALVKAGLPIDSKRVAVAGTGPLLLAVAAYLRRRGANVCCIAEQTSLGKLGLFGLGLLRTPSKIREAIRLRLQLRGVPYWTGCWPIAAEGDQQLTAVVFRAGRKTWRLPCDYLACGFGLIPNLELLSLMGCNIADGVVSFNEWQETSVANVYTAGETTGIGGLEKALVEGQIAGYAATQQRHRATELFPARQKAQRFARALQSAFALRGELKTLARADTIVCRCEDVPLGKLQLHANWRAAKLQTRCGMGPCQGRICGGAVDWLLGWNSTGVRPPIFPAQVATLAEPS